MSEAATWGAPEGLPISAGPYSLASITPDGLIHTAGLIAIDPDGDVVGVDDAGTQTCEIFAQARTILKAAGASLADVVFAHVFVSDMKHYPAMNAAYRDAFAETGRQLPPRYCIRADLVKDTLLVEIAFVARKG